MKTIETAVYGGLLAIAAGLAWSGWKAEKPDVVEDVAVFQPGDVRLVAWKGEDGEARIEVEGTGKAARVWITAGKPEKPPAGDDDDSAEPDAPAPALPPKLRTFPGNDQAISLVQEKLAPLKALREFPSISAEQATQMGFDAPEGSLRIEGSAGSVDLVVGDKAYGTSDTYVRHADGRVWLVSSKILAPIRAAESRLMDRALLPFEPLEARQAVVRNPAGGAVEAAHQGTHDKENAFWSRPSSPEAKDTALDAFLQKVFQLRASTYPAAGEPGPEVEPVLAVEFAGEAGPLGVIEVGRRVNAERSKPGEVVWDWMARSPLTRDQWVEVPRSGGSDLADALPGLIEG